MSLRYRQVHQDFHSSGEIPGVGSAFDSDSFRETLIDAAVDSITCFSVCHHGFSYYPTKVGVMHPTLKFDLLSAQMDAAHEVGIAVPVSLSAGGNDVAALTHPEWREINPPGVNGWGAQDDALCFYSDFWDCTARRNSTKWEEIAATLPSSIPIQRLILSATAEILDSAAAAQSTPDQKSKKFTLPISSRKTPSGVSA